jgi:uncharacterized membrane protein YoaK (UPF0700 family)
MAFNRPGDDLAIRRSLLGLTVVTGIVDAVSFLGLGHIFTANMTGNVVFLGFAIGGARGVSALRPMVALGAFACGGVCGGRAINARDRAPARSLLMAMRVESILLLVAVASTARAASELSSIAGYAVIVSTALAMGLRNAVVRRLGVPDLTTTVLTLTITGLAADSRLAGGGGERTGRRVLSIVAMCVGALCGSALLSRFGLAVALAAASILVVGLSWFLRSSLR